jgi:hypothetical protein
VEVVWEGEICEIIDLGGFEGYRLYCEGISSVREDHILDNLNVEYSVKSNSNSQMDGALILDFEKEDIDIVKFYFGDRNGE